MSTTTAPPPHTTQATPLGADSNGRRTRSLGSYVRVDSGQTREAVSLKRPDGSTLVVDYQHGTLSDGRLVAHLPADEPPENAQIVCELYLADDTKGRCCAVTAEDFDLTRHATAPSPADDAPTALDAVNDADGHVYRIRELPTLETMSELRWTRSREPDPESVSSATSSPPSKPTSRHERSRARRSPAAPETSPAGGCGRSTSVWPAARSC